MIIFKKILIYYTHRVALSLHVTTLLERIIQISKYRLLQNDNIIFYNL